MLGMGLTQVRDDLESQEDTLKAAALRGCASTLRAIVSVTYDDFIAVLNLNKD